MHFLTCVFKWPQYHSIFWALEDSRASEQVLEKPVAYCHVTRDTNCDVDDMAR